MAEMHDAADSRRRIPAGACHREGGTGQDGTSEILSFGAGINSSALAILLVNRGWRGHIVFSDTGAEWPETYCYMRYFEAEWLRPRGLEITILKGMPWQRVHGGVTLIEKCQRNRIIPLLFNRWCTVDWKIEPLRRYAAHVGAERMLVGIAADEAHRQKDRICPLIDEGITRQGCITIIKGEGLDVPQKSGCYICPAQRIDQWRALWERHPELFEVAAQLEVNAATHPRAQDKPENALLDPHGKRSLRDLERGFQAQTTLLDADEWADLQEYRPCMCTL